MTHNKDIDETSDKQNYIHKDAMTVEVLDNLNIRAIDSLSDKLNSDQTSELAIHDTNYLNRLHQAVTLFKPGSSHGINSYTSIMLKCILKKDSTIVTQQMCTNDPQAGCIIEILDKVDDSNFATTKARECMETYLDTKDNEQITTTQEITKLVVYNTPYQENYILIPSFLISALELEGDIMNICDEYLTTLEDDPNNIIQDSISSIRRSTFSDIDWSSMSLSKFSDPDGHEAHTVPVHLELGCDFPVSSYSSSLVSPISAFRHNRYNSYHFHEDNHQNIVFG